MATRSRIAVTGSTGVVGGSVAVDLADRGVAQRLLVHNPLGQPHTAIASNVMAEVSGDVEAITGEPPISLETYLRQQPR